MRDAGVVDETVDPAMAQNLCKDARDFALARHVTAVGCGPAAFIDDLPRYRLHGVGIQIENVDGSPARSEGQRDGPSDAAGPTGHDGTLAVQSKHVGAHCRSPDCRSLDGVLYSHGSVPRLGVIIYIANDAPLTAPGTRAAGGAPGSLARE